MAVKKSTIKLIFTLLFLFYIIVFNLVKLIFIKTIWAFKILHKTAIENKTVPKHQTINESNYDIDFKSTTSFDTIAPSSPDYIIADTNFKINFDQNSYNNTKEFWNISSWNMFSDQEVVLILKLTIPYQRRFIKSSEIIRIIILKMYCLTYLKTNIYLNLQGTSLDYIISKHENETYGDILYTFFCMCEYRVETNYLLTSDLDMSFFIELITNKIGINGLKIIENSSKLYLLALPKMDDINTNLFINLFPSFLVNITNQLLKNLTSDKPDEAFTKKIILYTTSIEKDEKRWKYILDVAKKLSDTYPFQSYRVYIIYCYLHPGIDKKISAKLTKQVVNNVKNNLETVFNQPTLELGLSKFEEINNSNQLEIKINWTEVEILNTNHVLQVKKINNFLGQKPELHLQITNKDSSFEDLF